MRDALYTRWKPASHNAQLLVRNNLCQGRPRPRKNTCPSARSGAFQTQIELETDTVKKEGLIQQQKMIIENVSFFFGDDFIKMKIVDNKYNEKYISPTEITGKYISGHIYNLNGETSSISIKIRIPLKNIARIKSYCE
jgi:hypothetical protein